MRRFPRTALWWFGALLAVCGAAYGGYVAMAWSRYGHAKAPDEREHDPLLNRFMPTYEIVERHSIRVDAPAAVTLDAAREIDLQSSPVVRGIFRAREVILGARADDRRRPRGLVAEMQSIGWGILAEVPGRELIAGAVTRPWEANVVFRPLPPDEFAAFSEPGYVKIVWTLRADPIDPGTSVFRSETRAIATDPDARHMFRRYWSLLSPGIIVIRWAMLGPLKAEAERRVRVARTSKEVQKEVQ